MTDFRKELNFRDLGGYPTMDGRIVKRGLLFRSAELALFNHEELKEVEKLGLKTILDFRSKAGSRLRPDPEIPGAEIIAMPAAFQNILEDLNSPASVADLFFDADQKGNLLDRLISTYTASLAFTNDAFGLMLKRIADRRLPLLFHCANGKDRTGVAAMLVHLLLGVSPEDTKKDYLLTNYHRKALIEEMKADHAFWAKHSDHALTLMEMLTGVIPESADMMLTEIPERYGSYDSFFEQEYGITPEIRESIREFCLTEKS